METLQHNWAAMLWTVFGCVATVVFIQVRAYFDDPERRKLNEEWFNSFEKNMIERYRDGDISWRAADLSMHFGKADTDEKTLAAWFRSKLSIFRK